MWKLGLGIVIFQRKGLGLLWACELAHSCSQQNTVIYWGKLSCKTLIPHTSLIREKKKKKSAAWQSWTSLHVLSWTQRANPEGTWVTNGGHGGTTTDSVTPSSAHTECADCSFIKRKCPRKIKCEGGVLSHFFPERGVQNNRPLHLVLRTKPETQCNRLLWATCFCSLYLSQHHWPLHFIAWRCQGKCVQSIPASPTEQWLCHFGSLWVLIPFPTPFSNSPWGCLFLIYI